MTDPDAAATPPLHRYIACAHCGKRMLVEIDEGSATHRCPVCGAVFVTTRNGNEVSVAFVADAE